MFVSILATIVVQIHANSTEPEFNCEHEPCEGGITRFENWSFPSACDSCDYNVWVKYTECPGNPIRINLEIMEASTIDSLTDPYL